MIQFTVLIQLLLTVNIYSFSVRTSDGQTIFLSQYQGKKILIVNTASGSSYASQLGSLESLRQRYGDSLVILAFPSNDFGHEPLVDSAISQTLHDQYSAGYIICAKGSVVGTNSIPLFQWLGDAAQNGSVNNPVPSDFFKCLIDENGNIRGLFSAPVDPMDSVITSAIETNYN